MPALEAVQSKSILTPTSGFLASFDYSLNPYVGCAFGCSYCYAASWVYDRGLQQSWGRWVRAKTNAPELLLKAAQRGKVAGSRIFLSSVTDPYQPAEKRLALTRGCLDVLAEYPPGLLLLQTRSPLVARDTDVLQRLGTAAVVAMSITTDREDVRRALEPACTPIARRIEALRQLRAAGVRTQASVAPLLPCNPDRLTALLDGVADRVVVSTFRDDGGAGSKTRSQAFEIYRAHGWDSEWLGDGYEYATVTALQRRFGGSVTVGQFGFNAV